MPPHVPNEKAKLERRLAKIRTDLAEREPVLMAELNAVEVALLNLTTPSDERYAGYRWPMDAVKAALEYEKQPSTKRELADILYRGGFKMDPEHGMRHVVDSITHAIARGRFIEIDGKVGLPEWKESKNIRK